MIEKRVDDKPFINLIRKWLKAGILDKGTVIHPTTGTPQGGIADTGKYISSLCVGYLVLWDCTSTLSGTSLSLSVCILG